MSTKLDEIKKLDSSYLLRSLNTLEEKLLNNCIEGFGVSGHDLPEKERFIRGDFLAWLCGNKEVSKFVHRLGIDISFAVIEGDINLFAATIPFPLKIRHTRIDRDLLLAGAKICNLDLSGSQIKGRLQAEDVQTEFSIMLREKFKSDKVVELMGAKIGGDLDCFDGHFTAERDYTIDARLINVQGSVRLVDSIHEQGEACFNDADVRGVIYCEGAKFTNEKEPNRYKPDNALSFERIRADGGIMLREGFTSVGRVCLHEAYIGGALDCEDGHFDSGKQIDAIDADGLITVGPVLMRRGFSAKGCVRLYNAKIGSDLDCQDASFSYKDIDDKPLFSRQDCFVGEGMKVDGKFNWSDHREKPKGFISFQNAHVKSYADDEKSMPETRTLNINGFVYDSYLHQEMYSAERRLRWLNLQPDYFNGLQPYSHLIKILRVNGYFEDAKRIAIERERKKRRNLSFWERSWSRLWEFTTDFGYRPEKVFIYMLLLIFVGFLVFEYAFQNGIMLPTKGEMSNYPNIVTLVYSLDVFLPIIDLHQEEFWLPSPNSPLGMLVSVYMWIHIAFGWFFTTLFAAAIASTVRTNPE